MLNKYFVVKFCPDLKNVAHAKATTLNFTTNCALRVHTFTLYSSCGVHSISESMKEIRDSWQTEDNVLNCCYTKDIKFAWRNFCVAFMLNLSVILPIMLNLYTKSTIFLCPWTGSLSFLDNGSTYTLHTWAYKYYEHLHIKNTAWLYAYIKLPLCPCRLKTREKATCLCVRTCVFVRAHQPL